jgi:oligopeptide/dipeptide ABC transporter ATP-binding protein
MLAAHGGRGNGMNELIAVEHAAVHFPVRRGFIGGKANVHAVDDVSLALHENETLALVGESGSGKTTLGLAILGLRALSSGEVRWRGKSLASLSGDERKAFRRDVQPVFQDPYASLNPRLQILEALRRPLALHRTVAQSELSAECERLLELVGLAPAHLYLDRYPHEFSGGQRQRIAIARALALRPTLLVADEPVSALDVSIRTQILKLLQTLKRELKLAMLFLSHDLGVVRHVADRVAVMYVGKIVEIAPVDALFQGPQHPYTRLLLSAAPSTRAIAPDPMIDVAGEPPSPTDPPSGCRFRTRCPFAFDRCSVEEPPLRDAGLQHRVACHLVAYPGQSAAHPTS